MELVHLLAQINVSRAIAPLDDPRMHDFVSQLDILNQLGDASPGFVCRLSGADGAASSYLHLGDDPLMLVNLTVWESLEALKAYAYSEPHATMLRNRRQWFHRSDTPSVALWWIDANTTPTVEQGMARLRHLALHGATSAAFTFTTPFAPPAAPIVESDGSLIRRNTDYWNATEST